MEIRNCTGLQRQKKGRLENLIKKNASKMRKDEQGKNNHTKRDSSEILEEHRHDKLKVVDWVI
ncbi:hypothetical protein H5410_058327 [Solanum commersonii]|uniref:Uncharacterized protein n=1 Tax=Solanum commersonii TaxID=4109 RepID=A0A9J5WQR9_SOLCO|nr:hypothetical protein H5410_058327 [Solanum commersonii]